MSVFDAFFNNEALQKLRKREEPTREERIEETILQEKARAISDFSSVWPGKSESINDQSYASTYQKAMKRPYSYSQTVTDKRIQAKEQETALIKNFLHQNIQNRGY